jgi:hypothetical protein
MDTLYPHIHSIQLTGSLLWAAEVHDDNIDKAQYVIFLREDGHIQHWSESAGRDEHSMGAHAATETDFYSSTDFQVRERTWVHFAVSRGEDNAVQFYINGQLDSHHTPEDGFNDPHFQHILTFGARTQGNGRYQDWFTGTLDVRAPLYASFSCHVISCG